MKQNVILLGLVSLFNDFSAEMIYAVMPAFLVGVLGAPPIVLGLIEGVADAVASFLKIISGWFSDRIRRRKNITVFGYGLSLLTRLGLVFVTNYWQVFGIRVLDRVGKGVRESPRDALLVESVEKPAVGGSFGYLRTLDQVGGILGPLLAVILLPILAYNYQNLFLIGFLIGILVLVLFIFVREPKSAPPPNPLNPPRLSFSLKAFPKKFKILLLSVFLFGLGAMPIPLILLKAQDTHTTGIGIPLMYLIYSLSFALLAIPFGRLSDKIGSRKVMAGGFIAAIISYLVLSRVESFTGIAFGFIIFGLYSAMTDGIGRTIASKLVESRLLASGEGFLGATIGIASFLAGLTGGYIWTSFGAIYAFLYGAIMMTVGLVVFLSLNHGRAGV